MAIVAGSEKGIGKAIARVFAAEGAKILVADLWLVLNHYR